MAKFVVSRPLDAFFEGREKQAERGAGVKIKAIENQGIAQVFASKGKTGAVERALKIKESPGKSTVTRELTALPISPGQWLVSASKTDGFAIGLGKKLKKNGYVSEQSDSRVTFRISGPRARELMQKGCRLDLDPSVTSKGWCAQTTMAQIGTTIHQIDDSPTYDVMVYSGFAQEFAEWLDHTGAQLGVVFSR